MKTRLVTLRTRIIFVAIFLTLTAWGDFYAAFDFVENACLCSAWNLMKNIVIDVNSSLKSTVVEIVVLRLRNPQNGCTYLQ